MRRLLSIATFIFIFNVVLMPLLGMANELAHDDHDGKTHITWSDDQVGNGLFQVAHEDYHDSVDLTIGLDDTLDHHHCHHTSVIGMATFVSHHIAVNVSNHYVIDTLFTLKSFPTLIEYPPRNA